MRTVVERFVEQSPMTIMARLVLQCALHDDWIDGAAAGTDDEPDGDAIREALFALAVDAIVAIAARQPGSLRAPHAFDGGGAAGFGPAVAALHDCMSRLRAGWGRALVKDSVELLLPATAPRPREGSRCTGGMRLRVLDGGMLCGHDAAGCGCGNPGGEAAVHARALPVYDPDLGMIVDLLPHERGRMHERAFAAVLREAVQPGELWIIDGRFDTDAILSGWPRRGGAFIVREHGRAAACRALGGWRDAGTHDGGVIREQAVGLAGACDASAALRRIEWRSAADDVVTLLTDLPAAQFDARHVVRLACRPWRDALPLGPVFDGALFGDVPTRAALLAHGIVAMAYNAFATMTSVVRAALDLDARDAERLPSHIADGVAATYTGMMIALPPEWWRRYDRLPATTLGQIVRLLAAHVDPRSERRKRRDSRLSAKSQALLRAATLERLLHDDGDDAATNVFSLRTIAMATRDFSSNPSKALRHASEALVMVTKYNRPIALLVSIDDWNRLLGEVRETSMTRLSLDYAGAMQNLRPAALGDASLNKLAAGEMATEAAAVQPCA
ncbi:prevent-host-death protein [Burkholderia ubonensis]|uniref:Prevent-host-death protein n=2 Tax=Burkholderia ubonensis TaxID=101571 RepID=A0A107G8J5_9BURK|nr:prevent-host-death protein [Burkholderia ubonensis]KWD76299.1 prevent-host-death protein [Burkholderia ubonensis]KWD99353.1 prevent-host-death protein [Burkholderia ubonensis]KWE07160.1 prevent-host-death protein [Burkholderia ubonensis]